MSRKWTIVKDLTNKPIAAYTTLDNHTIRIAYKKMSLFKKTLDKRRQCVIEQYITTSTEDVISKLSTAPTDETTEFLEKCLKYIKIQPKGNNQ